jgi:DNA-binding response OmpR family regulator
MVTVLVVDDDDDIREALGDFIEQEGFTVLRAANVNQAEDVLQANRVDMVLTDIKMPGRSGFELASHAKNTYKCRVVLMTGFNNSGTLAGFPVLTKPFALAELLKALEGL